MKDEKVIRLVSAFFGNHPDSAKALVLEEIQEQRRRGNDEVAAGLESALTRVTSPHASQTGHTQGALLAPLERTRPLRSVPRPQPAKAPHEASQSDGWTLENPAERLDDVVLPREISSQIERMVGELAHQDRLRAWGIDEVLRAVFQGAPGTGKTLAARALAGQAGRPLLTIRLDAVLSSFLGETSRNLGMAFDAAVRENAILFLDEVDAVAKHRDDPHELGEMKRVVNALLQNMDRTAKTLPIVAATNHQQLLDHAIWRRFTDILEFPLPDQTARQIILEKNLRQVPLDPSIKIPELARQTNDRTGAELVILVRNAVRHAITENHERLLPADLQVAIGELRGKATTELVSLDDQMKRILELSNEGMNQRDIGHRLKISAATVNRRLKNIAKERESTAI